MYVYFVNYDYVCFFFFALNSSVQLPGTQRGWATWLARWLAISLFYVYLYVRIISHRLILSFLSFTFYVNFFVTLFFSLLSSLYILSRTKTIELDFWIFIRLFFIFFFFLFNYFIYSIPINTDEFNLYS